MRVDSLSVLLKNMRPSKEHSVDRGPMSAFGDVVAATGDRQCWEAGRLNGRWFKCKKVRNGWLVTRRYVRMG